MLTPLLVGLLWAHVPVIEGRLLCNVTNITDTSVYNLYQVSYTLSFICLAELSR